MSDGTASPSWAPPAPSARSCSPSCASARFPAREIVPFASERSAGRELEGFGTVQPLSDETIQGFDLAVFSAGATTSGAWAQRFVEAGCVVVDNSSRLAPRRRRPARRRRGQPARARAPPRADRQPELLDDAADGRAQADPRRRGDRAADRLDLPVGLRHRRQGGRGAARRRRAPCSTAPSRRAPSVYPHPIAFNVLGGAGNFADGDDYTDEERKMMFETRKILEAPDIGISVTCARVPGDRRRTPSPSTCRRATAIEPDAVRELLRTAPGVEVVDDPAQHGYPTALAGAGRDEVLVGRIRRDPSHRARAEPVGGQRQPAQGRRDQRRPARRGAARARARARARSPPERVWNRPVRQSSSRELHPPDGHRAQPRAKPGAAVSPPPRETSLRLAVAAAAGVRTTHDVALGERAAWPWAAAPRRRRRFAPGAARLAALRPGRRGGAGGR